MTIDQIIQYWAEHQPDKPAFIFPENDDSGKKFSYTYVELKNTLEKYHSFFEKLGINKGDVFAIAMQNSCAAMELLLAGFYTRRVVMPLNLVSGNTAMAYVLNHCSPEIIFSSSKETEKIRCLALETSPEIIVLDTEVSPLDRPFTQRVSNSTKHRIDTSQGNQEEIPALLMYTSGTTGNPKGVLLSHQNLLAGGKNTVEAHELNSNDRGLCLLPLYHINAICISFMSAISSGSSLVLERKFSARRLFPIIEKHSITWASIVPTIASYMLNAIRTQEVSPQNHDLSSLQFVRSASAPLPVEVHEQFQEELGIPIVETIGITETSAQILSNPRPPKKCKIGSVGLPFGNEIRLINEQGQEVPDGTEGEIVIKGPNVMMGYYRDEETTRKAYTPDGWYLSGDLAIKDKEQYVRITGRKKELIIKGGENISPRELDEVLYTHPGVIEAAAFGRKCPNYGQNVEACVRLNKKNRPSAEELIELCHKAVGVFKAPDRIHIIEELPKGPSGKIQRMKLEKMIYQEK